MKRYACQHAALVVIATATLAWEMAAMEPAPGTFFVSANGSDEWSGTLPDVDAGQTDGPFASIARAQEAVRETPPHLDRQIVVRGGTYYLDAPVHIGPQDSGTRHHPVRYRAYPGEEVILSGGRPINGWSRGDGRIWSAPVPDARSGDWAFRQLRVGDRMQTPARHPNADPEQPTAGGWLFARQPMELEGGWSTTVGCIHTPGDWMEWDVEVPADGEYAMWLYYAQHMEPYGRDNMDGQTAVQVDDGPEVPLVNMPNTGNWNVFRWTRTATLELTAGTHTMRWTNRRGGGVNFNAFALCTDPDWVPQGTALPPPGTDHHLLIVQAEKHDRADSREMRISENGYKGRRDQLPFGADDIPEWDLRDAYIMLFPAWGWVGGPVDVGGIDRATRMLHLSGRNAQQEVRIGNRYYLANVREALDAPGEFYLDKDRGECLLIPWEDQTPTDRVVAPYLDRIIHIEGNPAEDAWPEYIHISGLQFRDTRYSTEVSSLYSPDDACVWIDHARHVRIEDCTFSHLGGYAVHLLRRAAHCRILGCRIHTMGQGGVIATGNNSDQPSDCIVAGCHMHDLGRVYKHVAGVYVTTGKRFRVAHCTITDVPRYAISFKSYNANAASHGCVAEFNEMLRTNLETNDTGAIETLGRDRRPTGNVIRYNLILDVVGMKHTPEGGILSPFYTWGIYLDDYSSGTRVVGNIVARTYRGGFHNHLGFDNIVENNIFVDGHLYQAEWNGRTEMRRNVFRRNIVVFSDPGAVYIRSSGWHRDVLRECDRNILWNPTENLNETARDITPEGDLEAWRAAGFDTHSFVADPLFVAPENDDYRLRPDSPALGMGFTPIPVDRIGIKGYRAGDY